MDARALTRFMQKVEKHDADCSCCEGCWIWMGALLRDGHGQFWLEGHSRSAHRNSYEHFVGPIPDGLTIDHLCRNTSCVNPAHLEAVTMRENVLRNSGPTAANARKTHCSRGHEFTPENTFRSRKGSRECRTCRRGYYQPKGVAA